MDQVMFYLDCLAAFGEVGKITSLPSDVYTIPTNQWKSKWSQMNSL